MANLLKEILHGIREELAFERAEPYRATLVSSGETFSNTQMRDQLAKLRRGPEAGSGAVSVPSTAEPSTPYESLNDRFERVAREMREKVTKEGAPRKNALEVFESFPSLESTPKPGHGKSTNVTPDLPPKVVHNDIEKEYGWIQQRINDLEKKEKDQGGKLSAEDKENLVQLKRSRITYQPFLGKQEDPKNKIRKGPEIQTQEKPKEDPDSVEHEKQLADFARRHKSGELKVEDYDSYRDLLEKDIDLLIKRVNAEKTREKQYPLEILRRRRVEEYLEATRRQVSMLIGYIKEGRIDTQAVREQYEKIKKDVERGLGQIHQHEIEAAQIYLDQVGRVLGIKKDSVGPTIPTLPQQEPKSEDGPRDDKIKPDEDYDRWLEVLKKSDDWESFLSNLNDIGYVVSGNRTLSSESIWKRVLRVKEEFGRAKGNNKINTPLVREAFMGIPPELRLAVTRLLGIKIDTPASSEPIGKDVPKPDTDPVAENISKVETWEDLDKAIREIGDLNSGGVEYSINDILSSVTDLRDAFKMADGNIKAPVFRSALGSVTRANGIRAKVLELLFREDDEKYFKAGDRVIFEDKKWDIVKIENGKAVIQTLSEDKKAMPDRVVSLADLTLEVKPAEAQVPIEEDFNETSPIETPSLERRSRALGLDGFPVGFERKPVTEATVAGPETTAIPEEIPQWKKDLQAQVNKSFEAYRGRFYRKYRWKESELYEEYQRKANRGWVGWLKDRSTSFSTFGITDFHAAEKFRTVTGEAGAQIEFVADALAREGAEANDTYIRGVVEQTLGRLVKQFEGKRSSDGRPILSEEKLKSLGDRLTIELRANQQEKLLRDRGELTKILRDGLDQKWWMQYVYGTVGTTLASINLSYVTMPMITKWIFGSAAVAPASSGVAEGAARGLLKGTASGAAEAAKNMPSAWNLATGENPWSVSEKLLRAAGKAVNPDTIKLVDAALCRENNIGVPEWAIPGSMKHSAVAVGTTLKLANALRVIASMP